MSNTTPRYTKDNVTVSMLESTVANLANMIEKHKLLKEKQTSFWNDEIVPLQEELHLMLEVLEKDSYKVEGVGHFIVETVEGYTLPKDPINRKKFFDYLKETDQYDSSINVAAPTVNAIVKNHVELAELQGDFDSLPAGIQRKLPTKRYKLNKA